MGCEGFGPETNINFCWAPGRPHTPKAVDGEVHALKSLRGTLEAGFSRPMAQLGAFVNGVECENGMQVGPARVRTLRLRDG